MSEYKIEAFRVESGPLTVVTSERRTALRYSAYFQSRDDITKVSVTIRGKAYIGDQIKELP